MSLFFLLRSLPEFPWADTTTQTHKFMALYNTSPDFGAVAGPNGGVVLIANTDLAISISAHEVLHTLGSPHSRLSSQTEPRTDGL